MKLKLLLRMMLLIVLVAPAVAQSGQQKLTTEGAPSLRIVSAPAKFDREKEKVKISLELKNIGSKTIKSFFWDYGAQGVIQEYKVVTRADMFEVSLDLPPNGQKRVVLLNGHASLDAFWKLSAREIRITSITFEDGTSWRRDKDN